MIYEIYTSVHTQKIEKRKKHVKMFTIILKDKFYKY